ncbi:MAG: LacI family DNA-binding transcriptional regulator [Clostridia bacterium]|nr:LacI family transcriptional regulator [Clostridiaceae bacterium]HPB16672.1 LacI family DNA-binding transcriptional regulator [Clostridia bacterium]HQM96942.1 LacI family DNA-binding transcriptional regulator [Clostridia bacterium]
MAKKYTMLDIAKAANVSKATVSYVLNDKQNARISEETRRRILQIANLYQYVPNLSAKYLCANKKKLIGIIIGDSSFKSFISECKIIYLLYEIFHADDYKLVLLDNKRQDNYMDLAYDLILAINISEEHIRNIGINTYSPMILFDSMFSDSLFFKIINDYPKAVEKAKATFNNDKECVMIYSIRNNKGINDLLEGIPLDKIAFTGLNRKEIDDFIYLNKEKNFIAIGDIAGFIALSTISYENLALITFSNNIAFPDTVTQIVFDNQELKNNIRRIFEKLDARQAQEQEQHIFWIEPN